MTPKEVTNLRTKQHYVILKTALSLLYIKGKLHLMAIESDQVKTASKQYKESDQLPADCFCLPFYKFRNQRQSDSTYIIGCFMEKQSINSNRHGE